MPNVNPDEMVAIGAAVQGVALSNGADDVLRLDANPLSIGHRDIGRRILPASSGAICRC